MYFRLESLIVLYLLFWLELLYSQVVLTEVMFDPVGNESHDEFVEIFNISQNEIINLAGWQISDGTGVDNLVSHESGLILSPGQFALILDPSYFDNSTAYDSLIPGNCLVIKIDNSTLGSGGLSNSTAETIVLKNTTGEIVSEYTYSLGNLSGHSDEKVDLMGTNSPDNWKNSNDQLGTPGNFNSVSPLQYDLGISANDIVFSTDNSTEGHVVKISAVVHNFGKMAVANFSVEFFDDRNSNNIPDFDELFGQSLKFENELLPGDSILLEIEYSFLDPGQHSILAVISFELDENVTNNQAGNSFVVGFEPNALRINEIMFVPVSGQPEWIEIVNTGLNDVSIENWAISDSDLNSTVLVESNVLIKSNEYLVIAEDSSIFNYYDLSSTSVIVQKKLPALDNDSDSITLFDLLMNTIDRVEYHKSWGTEGRSLEKINPDFVSNDSLNWSESVAPEGGTPGARNSIFADALPSRSVLSVEPNPFSPDSDGRDDFVVISYNLPVYTAQVHIKIYDLYGRLIRFLANNKSAGSVNSIVWDGKDNRGEVARIGIYVIFLQAINAQSGIIATQKKTLVLANKL